MYKWTYAVQICVVQGSAVVLLGKTKVIVSLKKTKAQNFQNITK